MNIIIVDDDKLVSLSLKTILEASGEVNVCAIGNCGEEALSLYPKFKPDILLMDIRMDGMSGLFSLRWGSPIFESPVTLAMFSSPPEPARQSGLPLPRAGQDLGAAAQPLPLAARAYACADS